MGLVVGEVKLTGSKRVAKCGSGVDHCFVDNNDFEYGGCNQQ